MTRPPCLPNGHRFATRGRSILTLGAAALLLAACREPSGLPVNETAVQANLGRKSAAADGYTVDAITLETRYWDSSPWVVPGVESSAWNASGAFPKGLGAMTTFNGLSRTMPGYTNTPIALPNLQCAVLIPGDPAIPSQGFYGSAEQRQGCIRNPGDGVTAYHANVATRYRLRVSASRNITLGVRFGADFRGGVMVVDGQVVTQNWSDPWWMGYFETDNGDFNTAGVYVTKWETDTQSVMVTSIAMRANSVHIIEVVGFEDGVDDGAAVQFNVGGPWQDAIAVVPSLTMPLTLSATNTGGGRITSTPTGIDCGATCRANFGWGTRPLLTPVADEFFVFSGWSGACTGTGACAPLLDAGQSVTATFTRLQYPLQVTRAGTGSGIVAGGSGAIDCGTTCRAGFNVGATVTLTATPSVSSTFAGWSGACTGPGNCTVSMNGAKTVTATFTPIASQADVDPPVLSCTATPDTLWPANHKMVDISVAVRLTDAGVGPAGFTLLSVTSNEPDDAKESSKKDEGDDAVGDGNTVNDMQGWRVTPTGASGQLRAERAGGGTGRIYTMLFRGTDLAGNATTASCAVTVPHDQKNKT